MSEERQRLLAPQDGPQDEEYPIELITISSDDPLHPTNLPAWRKWASASTLGAMTFAATYSSAVFNAVIPATAKQFNVAPQTMALATSLYIFGFAAGPILFGPASELYGRRRPFLIGYGAFVLSQVPVGLAQNVETILIFRFLGGVASSVSPAIVGGYLADFLPPVERGVAVAIFAATTLIGPSIGAICGSIIAQNALDWRWTAWSSLILGASFGIVGGAILPETYLPVLEQRHAQYLRQTRTSIRSRLDDKAVSIYDFVVRYLTRPFYMLVQEPILLLITLYISFTFGLVYLLFVAYPITFVQDRHFDLVDGSLPLLMVCVGILAGAIYVSWYSLTTLRKRALAHDGRLEPEARLPPMILGAFALAAGLFWFACTSSPSLNPWPQILSGLAIGFGIQVVLLQSLAYLIDIYTVNANSAISGTVAVRSILGGTFPIWALTMYSQLGVLRSSLLLAFAATLLAPLPVLFFFYGARIRSYSAFVSDKT